MLAAEVAYAAHLRDAQHAAVLDVFCRVLQVDDPVGDGELGIGLNFDGRIFADQQTGAAQDRKLCGQIEDRRPVVLSRGQHML
jgi:hypothetical protein